ncbi:hypothetical protein SDC9_114604 [bioreactor metagenome]|uniref:Uncharacterized protein n=1 Tax=bioreactor metagenome TaxID=1076179 RepID=A0A645BQH0_9ZZZZ|nr:hypothetical protein [Rikenellaceae bacterium]
MGNTINSFLAARKCEIRQKQIQELSMICKKKSNLHLIKYWGASNKIHADIYDHLAIQKIFNFLETVKNEYKVEVNLTVIFADTHALLNGYKAADFVPYFNEIKRLLEKQGCQFLMMSDVLSEELLKDQINSPWEFVENIILDTQIDDTHFKQGDSFEVLKNSALKHSYRLTHKSEYGSLGFQSKEQSVYAYIKLNLFEKKQIENKFKESIFLTYSSNEEGELICPNFLKLQIYTYQSGIRSRPWFMKN